MFERLAEIEGKHRELSRQLEDPAVHSDPKLLAETGKKLAELAPLVRLFNEHRELQEQLSACWRDVIDGPSRSEVLDYRDE